MREWKTDRFSVTFDEEEDALYVRMHTPGDRYTVSYFPLDKPTFEGNGLKITRTDERAWGPKNNKEEA